MLKMKMENIFRLYLILLSGIILQSCKDDNVSDVQVYNINPREALDYHIEDKDITEYIKLESCHDCLISFVDDMKVSNGKIYILDTHGRRTLFVFNKEGKFLFKIKADADPLSTVDYMSSFLVAEEKIFVVDRNGSKINIYDQYGSFLGKVKFPFLISNITDLPYGGYFLKTADPYHEDWPYNYLVLDHDFNIVEGFRKREDEAFLTTGRRHVFTPCPDNKIIITEAWNDTMFYYDNNKIRPLCYVDFGKYALPSVSRKKSRDEVIHKMFLGNLCASSILSARCSQKELSFEYTFNQEVGLRSINRNMVYIDENRYLNIDNLIIADSISLDYFPQGFSEGIYYSAQPTYKISSSDNEFQEGEYGLFNTIDEVKEKSSKYDNPVIIKFQISI